MCVPYDLIRPIAEDAANGTPYTFMVIETGGHILYDPDPAPPLRCEPRRRTGHVFPSNPAGAETPHLLITVYPDRRYLALTAEVREVRGGTRDICKVVSAPKGEAYVGA